MKGGWQYVAGFFDGEATIQFDLGRRHLPCLVFYQNTSLVLQEIKNFLESEGILSRISNPARSLGSFSDKPVLRLRIGKWENVEKCLICMLPYLIVKKAAAQDCLRYRKLYPALNHLQYPEAAKATRWKGKGHSSDPHYLYKSQWYRENKGVSA